MASILQNLRKVHAAVVAQQIENGRSPLSQALNAAAVEAATKGITSTAWKRYMAVFADNPDQLTRLTKPQEDEEAYLKQFRAYIVSNAICTPETNAFLNNKVGNEIDGVEGLPTNPPVSTEKSDPDGVLAAVARPEGLESIPLRDDD